MSRDLNVIGHRGAAGLLPENTLAGFKKAIELGVDAIELDIHLTADGEAVVYHNAGLNPAITRDTSGKWVKNFPLVKELTLKEVKSHDVGKLNRLKRYARNFPHQKPVQGERIPTFREVIQLVKKTGEKTNLFVETKFSPLKPEETRSREEISDVVATIIKTEAIEDRVTVISFDWEILRYFQKIMPEIPIGYITIANGLDMVKKKISSFSSWTGAIDIHQFDSIAGAVKQAGGTYWVSHYYHAVGHRKGMTSKIVEDAHAEGVKVVVWTPDSKFVMEELIQTGVDGITTNRPDILVSLLGR